MLGSLKKWMQDVTIDLTPPPPRTSPSSSSIPGSTTHYFYSTAPLHKQQKTINSSSSAVYLSSPISFDSVRSTKTNAIPIPPSPGSPVELDLSHLNQEEQQHIADVLRRARAVESQQSTLPSVAVSSILSPAASISPSISSSTSTSSFTSQQLEKYDNEIQNEIGKNIPSPESTLLAIRQCEICGKENQENLTTCFQCQENEAIEREMENNATPVSPIKNSLSPIAITYDNREEKEDRICDNIITIDPEQIKQESPVQEFQSDIDQDQSPTYNVTEIDENEFLYEEPSLYAEVVATSSTITSRIEEPTMPSYKIDEYIDEDDHDERDHVKELEETIANLSRRFPSSTIESEQIHIDPLTPLTMNEIDTDSILEMEIESPSADEIFSPLNPLSLSISVSTPNNNRRSSLSRSSGVRENLTDLLRAVKKSAHASDDQLLQRTLSTHRKRMLSIHRPKRNLPDVPITSVQLQLRRVNSESRFSLPAVPHQTIDDECDLLEIDLNDSIDSTNKSLRSETESELINSTENNLHLISFNKTNSSSSIDELSTSSEKRVKQLRDQTTNTPPISTFNLSKKKLKKKSSSSLNHTNDQITPPVTPSITKLQKSTSTEITYPFPVTKLILNPSRQDLGFRITGGHSIPNCMEVTACIEHIDIHHKNYEIIKNTVQEGDEVLELGGISLRGKSALFVENLMNKIQNEFEIIVRSQPLITSDQINSTTIPRRHSMDTSQFSSPYPTVMKSKSTSIYSFDHTSPIEDSIVNDNDTQEEKPSSLKMLTSNEGSTHRHRNSLLPNDPGLNGAGNNISIHRENSNESDESDTLSQYFQSSQSRKSSLMTSRPHGRSQSVIPVANDRTKRLQNFFKLNGKQHSKDSPSVERKSSSALAALIFLKKKTKSVDFSNQQNIIINQLRANDYVGDIEIQIGHDSEREQLVIRIIRAKNLLPKDTNGFSDPFVKVYLLPGRDQENKRRIKYVSKTLNPVWNHTVVYRHIHREELQHKNLEFTVWDYDRFKANDFLGQVTIHLKNPNAIDDKPHWYRLQALRLREEITNRGSTPRLFNMASVDSAGSSTLTLNKNSVNIQPRINQNK